MIIYLVCRSWADGYEDFGWEILKAFHAEDAANDYCMEQEFKAARNGSNDEFYVEHLGVC